MNVCKKSFEIILETSLELITHTREFVKNLFRVSLKCIEHSGDATMRTYYSSVAINAKRCVETFFINIDKQSAYLEIIEINK